MGTALISKKRQTAAKRQRCRQKLLGSSRQQADTVAAIDTTSGATVTSAAIKKAVAERLQKLRKQTRIRTKKSDM